MKPHMPHVTAPALILFVDDEPNILNSLKRWTLSVKEPWRFRFFPGGEEALAGMRGNPADIVVTDMRMPGMTGAQLLQKVAELYPDTGRIILSGHADPTSAALAERYAHAYLQKPVQHDVLRDAIAKVLRERRPDKTRRIS